MEVILTLIGFIVLLPVLVIYGTWAKGYVLYKFWGWFVLPIFPQIPHIPLIGAMGIVLVVTAFKSSSSSVNIKDEFKESKTQQLAVALISPWMTLLCGWMIHAIFM